MCSCAKEERDKFKGGHRAYVRRMKDKALGFPSALCNQGRQGGCRAKS